MRQSRLSSDHLPGVEWAFRNLSSYHHGVNVGQRMRAGDDEYRKNVEELGKGERDAQMQGIRDKSRNERER